MKIIKKQFNIHNILKIRLSYADNERFIIDSINFPFLYFEEYNEADPEITFNFGPFKREKTYCETVFRDTEVSKNYIYYRGEKNGSLYEVEITDGYEGNIMINFNWIKKNLRDSFFPFYLPQLIGLEPMIEYKLLQKSWVLLHGAGIATGNGASIFIGRSGSYKSPITKICLKDMNYKYMGDDKIVIKDNFAYSFPKNLSFFKYELSRDNSMIELNSTIEKLQAIFYLYLNKNIAPLEIQRKEKINSIFKIIKTDQTTKEITLVDINKESLISSMVYNNYAEFWNYYDIWNHLMAYAYVYDDSMFTDYRNILYNNLSNNLKYIKNTYQILIPRNCSEFEIKRFLKNEINN